MSAPQPDAKCPTCKRTAATHASGCSVLDCPNRHPQVWGEPQGVHGFPGLLAEDRIIPRRVEKDLAASVGIAEQ
jgi:hypothetical protein